MSQTIDSLKLLARRGIAEACDRAGITAQVALRATPSWRILMYHRITTPGAAGYPLDPGMFVTPRTFERHMEYLAATHNVISLDELAQKAYAGEAIPSRTIALTFDDGWLDNYKSAFPVLKKLNLPATIFLATGMIGSERTLWTDEVARLLFRLFQSGEVLRFSKDITDSDDMPSLVTTPFNRYLHEASKHAYQKMTREVVDALFKLARVERDAAITALKERASKSLTPEGERYFLNWEEVREMARANVTFGCHTHSHELLPTLTPEEIEDEVTRSLETIKGYEIKPSKVFCYPGGAHDVKTQNVLRQLGWRYALRAAKGSAFDETPALLGRIGVHEDVTSTASMLGFRTWIY